MNYFKSKDRFDFSKNSLNIGTPLLKFPLREDDFFLKKIYGLKESEFLEFYNYQLINYLDVNPGKGKRFLNHVYNIVTSRMESFNKRKPYSNSYYEVRREVTNLEFFLEFLESVPHWDDIAPKESLIVEKNKTISQMQEKIERLEAQLKEYKLYDAAEPIAINKGALPVFIDLIHQMQNLKMPNGNKLLSSQTRSPWYKMIAKYFYHGDKRIPIGTAQNYFESKEESNSSKYIILDEMVI